MSKILKYPKVTGKYTPSFEGFAGKTYCLPKGYDLVEQIGGGGFST